MRKSLCLAMLLSATIVLAQGRPSVAGSQSAEGKAYQAYICRQRGALLFRSWDTTEFLERLKDKELITVLRKDGNMFNVRTARNTEGYVEGVSVCKGSPPTGNSGAQQAPAAAPEAPDEWKAWKDQEQKSLTYEQQRYAEQIAREKAAQAQADQLAKIQGEALNKAMALLPQLERAAGDERTRLEKEFEMWMAIRFTDTKRELEKLAPIMSALGSGEIKEV